MIAIAGDVLLMLVLAMALLQALAPQLARWRRDARYEQLIWPAARMQVACATTALLLLMLAYAISDFSLLNVALNSHSEKPLLYKITGSWGNHEGSMLLWLWVLSALSVAAATRRPALRRPMLSVQGWMMAGLALYVLAASSPFVAVEPVPSQGQGLNPLLQDIGLAIHPPMLYLGYVGFGVVFAYAIAAMRVGICDAAWARLVHPWIALSWGCLTFGIGLGSWWAYRELGWGGWWFWDPVENVSLLPWLSGTALLHANITLMKRNQMARWTLLLAIITFALSLIGTFIVRSGLLVSVHSFASDPTRGVLILIYITLTIAATLYAYCRFEQAANPERIRLLSRAGLMLLNHLLMLSAAATVLLAILYPLLLQTFGLGSLSVGAPYFNSTMLPLMAPAVLLAGIAPLLHWQQGDLRTLAMQIRQPLLITLVVAIAAGALAAREATLTALGLGLSIWLLASTAQALRQMKRRAGRINTSGWSMALAHAGFAVLVAGITIHSLHQETYEFRMKKGATQTREGITLSFERDQLAKRENYGVRISTVSIERKGEPIATLTPELRYYPARAMHTTEAAIDSNWLRDVYLVSALQDKPDRLAFTLHFNPAMRWVWLGFALVAAGGWLVAFNYLKRSHHEH